MATIIAARTALPTNYYPQAALLEATQRLWPAHHRVLERFFQRVQVEGRHLALPVERYARPLGLRERTREWRRVALQLGGQALESLLSAGGLAGDQVDLLLTSTVTGLSVPSLDALLVHRFGLAPGVTRMPLFGLGCAGGAGGIARAADYLRGHPHHAAVVLSVELCSLTLQPRDRSAANIIGSGLFGDGAGAVLLVGDRHPLAARGHGRVLATGSWLVPHSERVMGWDVEDDGFHLVMTQEVPRLVRDVLPVQIDGFLARHGRVLEEVETWVVHPGGPAVLDALQQGLSLPSDALAVSRDSLVRVGNMSSASVIAVLEQTLREAPPRPGSYGLVLAMGPGFGAEMALVAW